MPNPLESFGGSPVAPNQDAGQGNALQQGAPQQSQQLPPAPSHAQVVVGLRHLNAIQDELRILLSNPSLGKTSVKSQIISGMTNLVGARIVSPATAVTQLSQIPDDPLQQRKFLQQQMMQSIQAERGLLAHHAMGYAGGGPEPTPSADSHLDDAAGLQAHYQK